MEQAAGGTEVLVSKRGRPFVRLLGAEALEAEAVTPPGAEASLELPPDAD